MGQVSSASSMRPLLVLGNGGMCFVELVVSREGNFQRLFARKRLHNHLRDDEHLRAMLLNEAWIAGLIRHPSVVSVLDVGQDALGPYLLMEYVDGLTLAEICSTARAVQQVLPAQLCVRIALQVAEGLAAAHELTSSDGSALGLIHRDVSPQNILVGFDGIARLADFGIAKAQERNNHTVTGVFKGKLGYASPEHLTFQELDARSDLFSLGVVLYELLTNTRLYKDHTRDLTSNAVPDVGLDRDDLPPRLVELCFSLLAKARDDRPRSAQQVVLVLREVLDELVTEEGEISIRDYVERAFASRRQEQRDRIRTALTELAPTTADTTQPAQRSPAEGSSGWRWAIALGALVALVSVIGVLSRRPSGAPTEVVVTLRTVPAGAQVRDRGTLIGVTPADLRLPRSVDPVNLDVALGGFEPLSRQIIPDRDQLLEVQLVAQAVPPTPEIPVATVDSMVPPVPVAKVQPKARHSPRKPPPPKNPERTFERVE